MRCTTGLTFLFCALGLASLCSSCTPPAPAAEPTPDAVTETGLKDYFAGDFLVGAAVGKAQNRGNDPRGLELVAREFNTVTPENDLKWRNIHPARDTFNWGPADNYVAFGEAHDMWIVGHALVWYLQLADYVKEVTEAEEMRTVLQEHIDSVAGRYRGRIDAWDVLNEAVNDDGTMRSWPVYDVLGEDYVAEVFKMARAAAPDAELYYNDYNLWMPAKREGAIRMLKKALAAGAPIDGIGMQAHYALDDPTIDQVEASLVAFHEELGIQVMITELDIDVLPRAWEKLSADPSLKYNPTPELDPYTEGLPVSVAAAQGDRYQDLFRLFLKHRDKIHRVTFWNTHDAASWLNGNPIRGRTNYPLLFGRDYERKAGYDSVRVVKER